MTKPFYPRGRPDRGKKPWPNIEQFLQTTNEIKPVTPSIHVETKVQQVLDDQALLLFIQTIRNTYESPGIAAIAVNEKTTFRQLYVQLSGR